MNKVLARCWSEGDGDGGQNIRMGGVAHYEQYQQYLAQEIEVLVCSVQEEHLMLADDDANSSASPGARSWLGMAILERAMCLLVAFLALRAICNI